jgi:hypothetical protein
MPKNVLITEDDKVSAKFLQESLKSLKYNVVDIAQTAEEAIKLAGIHNPDIVIMDINLPGDVDGIEATKRIRTIHKIPVVYLTSHSDTDTLERALTTEPNGYLLKPFKKQELFTVIEMALYRDTLEKKLKANEQFLALTLECIGDGLITTDNNGNITLINKEAEKLTGFSIKEVRGKNIFQIYPVAIEDSKEIFKSFDDLLKFYFSEEQNKDLILTLKDKTVIPISQTIAPIKDEDNNIKGYIITFRDISLMKKAQITLRRINEELEERVAQRTVELRNKNFELESEIQKRKIVESNLYKALEKEKELNELKSRVVTTISHEFKTPITSILSSIELLSKYTINHPVSEKISKHYEIIRNASKVLTQMVNDVLLIEKIDADKYEFHFQEGNIGDFVNEIIDDFQSSSGKNHKFFFETKNLPESTLIEKTLLRRILNNLISNSIKYSKENTVINVSLEYQSNKFTLTVTDKGIGIPDEDQKYLFNLFHRARNVINYEGTGLGLSIIFKSVTLLNGNIRLKSKVGKGTSFIIVFPEHLPENTEN